MPPFNIYSQIWRIYRHSVVCGLSLFPCVCPWVISWLLRSLLLICAVLLYFPSLPPLSSSSLSIQFLLLAPVCFLATFSIFFTLDAIYGFTGRLFSAEAVQMSGLMKWLVVSVIRRQGEGCCKSLTHLATWAAAPQHGSGLENMRSWVHFWVN